MAQRQLQETVNLPPSGFIGSSPIAPTIFGSIVKRISRNATDVVLKVRILLDPPSAQVTELAYVSVLEAEF